MKKYLFIASAALLALAACSKVNYVEEPDQLIKFNVANYVNSTKAQGVVYYPSASFGSYAFILPSDQTFDGSTSELVKYMDNVEVKLSNGQWAPVGAYYWPKQSKLTFASYSPKMADGVAPTYSRAGWAMASYTAEAHVLDGTDADAAYDLMFSDVSLSKDCTSETNAGGTTITDDAEEGTTDHGYKGVPTLFRHQLAKVGLVFQTVPELAAPSVTSHEITINSVKLSSIGKTAAFANNEWGNATETGDYDYSISSKSLGVITKETTEVAKTDEVAMILLPQTLTAGAQKLEVEYTLVTKYGEKSVSEPLTAEIDLVSEAVPAWSINQHIVYTVTIRPFAQEPIVYDPAVVNWSAITPGELTIQ